MNSKPEAWAYRSRVLLLAASMSLPACGSSESNTAAVGQDDASVTATGGMSSGGAPSGGASPGGSGGARPGSGGASTGGAAPMLSPCTGSEATLCSTTNQPKCSQGGFECSCLCECASCQGLGPCPCTGPCTWGCRFGGYSDLLQNPSATVSLDCKNPSNPTLSITTSIDYTATSSGPPLLVDNLGIYVELEQTGQTGFSCQVNTPMSPAEVGPIAPGASTKATQTTGPVSSCDAGGNPPKSLAPACALCGGTAHVSLGISVKNADSPTNQVQGTFLVLGAQPNGTSFPITCTR